MVALEEGGDRATLPTEAKYVKVNKTSFSGSPNAFKVE